MSIMSVYLSVVPATSSLDFGQGLGFRLSKLWNGVPLFLAPPIHGGHGGVATVKTGWPQFQKIREKRTHCFPPGKNALLLRFP